MTPRHSISALRPAVAAATTGLLVGAGIVATRAVVDQAGPASLALLRYLIGFLFLLPAVIWSGIPRFERRDLLPIGLLGIAQFGILVALLNYSLQFIPSARAALIFATMPLQTIVLAAALGRERLTVAKLAGVFATIAGLFFLMADQVIRMTVTFLLGIGS